MAVREAMRRGDGRMGAWAHGRMAAAHLLNAGQTV